MFRSFIIAFGLLGLLGCSTTDPATQAENNAKHQACAVALEKSKTIRITSDHAVIARCSFVGNVHGVEWKESGQVMSVKEEDRCFFVGSTGAIHTADEVIRFSAAQLGADTIFAVPTGKEYT